MVTEQFKGRSFLVTGASSGIGRETARLLTEKGANVVTMAGTASALESLCHECGANMQPVPGDVSEERAWQEVSIPGLWQVKYLMVSSSARGPW